jgi:hypothetical protein
LEKGEKELYCGCSYLIAFYGVYKMSGYKNEKKIFDVFKGEIDEEIFEEEFLTEEIEEGIENKVIKKGKIIVKKELDLRDKKDKEKKRTNEKKQRQEGI